MMRRRTGITACVAVLAAAGSAGFVLSRPAPAAQAAAEHRPATTGVAKVTRQDLVQSESFTGTLGYADPRAIAAAAAGTITGLAAAGATINRGGALYAVNESAVRLLYGTVPTYRALGPGATDGKDVQQLEANLAALGFGDEDLTVDEDWTAATTRSVKAWQESRGVTENGTVDLGSVVFLPGPVRIGEHKLAVGDAAQPGVPVVQVTSTAREVVVDLDADDAAIATLNAAVTVALSDGTSAKGTIAAIASVAHSSGQEGGGAVIPVTISLTPQEARKLRSLDQAPVEVGFERSRARQVLTVPVIALVALAEGGYAVEVTDTAGTRLVGVEVGAFADGRVEVSGDGVADGASVVVPA